MIVRMITTVLCSPLLSTRLKAGRSKRGSFRGSVQRSGAPLGCSGGGHHAEAAPMTSAAASAGQPADCAAFACFGEVMFQKMLANVETGGLQF